MNELPGHAVLALLLPGTVGFLIPWLILNVGQSRPFIDPLGLIPFVVGVVLLLRWLRAFYSTGKGPPARGRLRGT